MSSRDPLRLPATHEARASLTGVPLCLLPLGAGLGRGARAGGDARGREPPFGHAARGAQKRGTPPIATITRSTWPFMCSRSPSHRPLPTTKASHLQDELETALAYGSAAACTCSFLFSPPPPTRRRPPSPLSPPPAALTMQRLSLRARARALSGIASSSRRCARRTAACSASWRARRASARAPCVPHVVQAGLSQRPRAHGSPAPVPPPQSLTADLLADGRRPQGEPEGGRSAAQYRRTLDDQAREFQVRRRRMEASLPAPCVRHGP